MHNSARNTCQLLHKTVQQQTREGSKKNGMFQNQQQNYVGNVSVNSKQDHAPLGKSLGKSRSI